MEKHIIYVEDGKDFQEYCYKDRKKVSIGKRIGIEKKNKKGKWELLLDEGIYFKN